jgi:hypothetical protein
VGLAIRESRARISAAKEEENAVCVVIASMDRVLA